MFNKIDKMYAFIAKNKNGEGVVSLFNQTTGHWVPLVGADMERVESIKPLAQQAARETGVDVVLVEFTTRQEIERFKAHEYQEEKI